MSSFPQLNRETAKDASCFPSTSSSHRALYPPSCMSSCHCLLLMPFTRIPATTIVKLYHSILLSDPFCARHLQHDLYDPSSDAIGIAFVIYQNIK
ncbi:unnamed protein product [Protopolystoma xenopodis]|uniref:Uncharacterized protein n=1 Tax=Protopolystoma xenopodis TaxID=117903 RepID=A0A3S5BRE6_9PLAT|nr:unnamed protein product [Protopolystoma xenopodis]